MKRITIESTIGGHISRTIEQAQQIAKEKGQDVEFDFNGVNVVVNATTNPELLLRDFMNAYKMDWKEVGPVCEENYSQDTLDRLDKRTKELEAEAEERQRQYELAEDKKREDFQKLVEGVEMEYAEGGKAKWDEGSAKNQDGYGAAIYRYASDWARLMQALLKTNPTQTVRDIADKASHNADIEGITGFMYGAAVSILSTCWVNGEDLRKWHNKEYGHEGDGVVNPAILTIS